MRPALRFGAFIAPFHRPDRDPTLSLRRDLDLISLLDGLGFEEVWIGEHHSGGTEIIGAPDIFMAVAAERTRRILLGTGVVSLPYHHPFLVADRIVLLDHLTSGRVMLGCGPGALPSDAHMMGIDVHRQRAMMEESLEAVLALLEGNQPVDRRTDWFELRDAILQLRPFHSTGIEVAVAAQVSAAGPRAAGRFGLGMLSLGATSARGFENLARHWEIVHERAERHGQVADRGRWRLVGPMHLAPTAEQARADVEYGLRHWISYFQRVAALPVAAGIDPSGDLVDQMNATGLAVIGTPEMAVAQLDRLVAKSGGFGAYLVAAHDWAPPSSTHLSFELFASEVAPHFRHHVAALEGSRDWAAANRDGFVEARDRAVAEASALYVAEVGVENAAD